MNFQHDLFLLMFNLSQLRRRDKIIQIFCESISEFFQPTTFYYSDKQNEEMILCEEVRTRNSSYGFIYTDNILNINIFPILQNAIQMLALLLERLSYENKLKQEKQTLKTIASERLKKINQYVKELEQAKLASLNLVEDLTEEINLKEKAQRTLIENEKKLQNYIESAPNGIFVSDSKGNYIEVNKSAVRITGYSREDLLEMNSIELYPADELSQAEAHFISVNTNGQATGDFKFIRKDQSIGYMTVDTVKLSDDRFMGFVTDITARKLAEEALEQRIVSLTRPIGDTSDITFEELFYLNDIQQLQDEFSKATGVASIIINPDGIPITKPSNFCRLCKDVIPKTENEITNCFTSNDMMGRSSSIDSGIQQSMSGGLWDAGARIRVGGKHIANWLIGQVRNENQDEETMIEYAHQIGVEEDIFLKAFKEIPSMKHEQFQHIAQVLNTLASQISKTAYQNVQQARFITESIKAEKQIKASLAEKEVLVQEVHHRVKNNLQIIISLLNLEMEHYGKTSRVHNDTISRIQKFSNIHNKLYIQEDISNIDFAITIKEIADELISMYASNTKTIKLNIDIPNPIVTINLAIPLALIINELITNSMKYAFENNGVIDISIHIDQEGQINKFIYSDNGKGMINNTPGFGTKMINILAEQLGLSTIITTKNGTCYKFEPKKSDTLTKPPDANILYVEDEYIIALDRISSIKKAGFHINDEVIPSGEKALQYVRESLNKPSLILMDIGLSGNLDGIETAREIRRDYNMPIIFLTGYEDIMKKFEMNSVSNCQFLPKTISDNELEKEIKKILNKS